MIREIDFSDENIQRLKDFTARNRGVNFKLFNFNEIAAVDNLDWTGFEDSREILFELVKAYQRILRIMPERKEDYAFIFLKNRVHSAMQVASMSMKQYMTAVTEMIPDDREGAEEIYNRALNRRSTILVQYMDILQNSEPHISAARFN